MRERDAVDRVLAGLGGAEPGAGMEDRVLRRLAVEREAAAGGRNWSWRWAVAGIVGCGLAAGWVVGHGRHPVAAPPVSRLGRPQAVSPKAPIVAVSGLPVGKRHGRGEARVRPRTMRVEAPAAGAGFPAPAMGLTEQERLLVAVARLHDPAQVALLSARAKAAREAEESARFETFFKPVSRERVVLITEFKPSVQPAGGR